MADINELDAEPLEAEVVADDDEYDDESEDTTKLINSLHDCYQLLLHMQDVDKRGSVLTRNRRLFLDNTTSEVGEILGFEG